MINSEICENIGEQYIDEIKKEIDKMLLQDEQSSLSRSEIHKCIELAKDRLKGCELDANKQ